MKLLILFLVLVCTSACTTPKKLLLRSDVPVPELGLCVEYGIGVPEEMQAGFDEHLQAFVAEYNRRPHGIHLYPCEDADTQSLRLQVIGTKMVESSDQVLGAAVSAVGLSAPFLMVAAGLPIFVTFYYFPQNVSPIDLSLSNDVSEVPHYRVGRIHKSWAFLVRRKKQMLRHPKKIKWLMSKIMRDLEKRQQKYARRERMAAEG